MRFVLPYWIATLACLSPLCTTARLTAAGPAENALDNWPAWRGPLATGEAPRGNPPVRWSETENVRWKLALPGLAHSTPIVWECDLKSTWSPRPIDAGLCYGAKI